MIEMQFNSNSPQASRGGVTVSGAFASSIFAASAYPKAGTFTNNEPISVLDTRSPSPSTSTSTFSSFNTTNPQGNQNDDVLKIGVAELQPPLHNLGLVDWENLSESAGKQDEILKLLLQGGNQNDDVLGFVGFGGMDSSSDFTGLLGLSDSGFLQCSAPCVAFQEEQTLDQKVEIFNPQGNLNPVLLARNTANPNNPLLFSTQQEQQNQLQPQIPKHRNIEVPFVDPTHQLLPIKQQILPQMLHSPEMAVLVPKLEENGVCNEFVYEQLYKAAELIQTGNFSNAQGILARLNHFLSPIGKPFIRSAFYVKEALELAFAMPKQRIPSPFDGMFKMGAYKVFSEVSPVIHFMNFTANQIILEAVGDAEQIHIIDFDIGFGAHWSSFLQELPRKNRGVTSVKITAFASPTTHHSLEISLMHENLTQFADDLGIKFALDVVNIDSFDPKCNSVSSFRSSVSEAIAVNFPIWSLGTYMSALPSYLYLIKRLSPKIVVSIGRGCEQIDLPFSHHILHTLQYYEALLDSVDSANVTSDASNKIEKFLFQPRIESTVLGRLVGPHVMTPWRNLFASVGYTPTSISNFAVAQAECVLKKLQVSGFRVERQHDASLLLCWKSCELLSVSAWNC